MMFQSRWYVWGYDVDDDNLAKINESQEQRYQYEKTDVEFLVNI